MNAPCRRAVVTVNELVARLAELRDRALKARLWLRLAPPRRCTQEETDSLIGCPKIVTEAPKRDMKLDRGHFRNDMWLESIDGQANFRAFMRRSVDLPENFSIGLVSSPRTALAKSTYCAATDRTAPTTTPSTRNTRTATSMCTVHAPT